MVQKLTRRSFAVGAGAAALAAPYVGRARAQGRQIVVSGWGGTAQDALRKAFFEPFAHESGISVQEVTWGGQGLARLKAQADAGRVEVDVLDGPPFWGTLGKRNGLLQPLDLSGVVDPGRHLPGAIAEMSYGYGTISWGLTRLDAGTGPGNWAEFWDTKRFTGRRAFFGPIPVRHLEYALMADGVPAASVYPFDAARVDRAFDKLEEIKPGINVWYQTSSQMELLFQSGEIDYAEFLSGRAHYLQSQGLKLDFSYDQAVMNQLVWVMARNSPNRESATKFIAFCSRPDRQAEYARLMFYGPTNLDALDDIKDDKLLRSLPTYPDNLKVQVQMDAAWWAENLDRLGARWNKITAG